ncbi:MAG: DUF935 domain-containing protein [Eubacteriales bacterium]|nr:DUF935 domain-containing protein [Eubacteriales bacterium]
MTIYGTDGKPIRKNKPVLDQIAVVSVRDRWSSYPSQGLTPDKLARIFKEADAGDVYRQMELFEEMEEKDTHLFSELQKRKQAVLGLEYTIVPYSKEPADVKAAELVEQAMEFEGLEEVLLDILDAIGKGFSASEIMWAIKDGQALPERVEWVQPKRITFGDPPYSDPNEFRLITDQEPVRGIPLIDNKFIVHRYKARSGHPSRAGIIRVCAWMYLFKNYALKDWLTFAEVYGMPMRLGKYDGTTSPEDKDALMQAIIQLGTDAAGIISKSTEIEFIQAMKGTSSGDNIFLALAGFCNKEMSKAVLGQTLTTDVGSSGSYAAGKVHDGVRHDLTKADAKALAETLRRYLFRPVVRFNLGDKPRLPWLKYDVSEPEDLEKSALTYSVLIKDCGLPVSQKHVYEKFGIPEPAKGEEILVPPGNTAAEPTAMKAMKGSVPTDPQLDIDALADRAREQAMAALEQMIEPVRQLIESGSSLEEIRSRLPQLFDKMDERQLEDILAQAMFVADLYGRYADSGQD